MLSELVGAWEAVRLAIPLDLDSIWIFQIGKKAGFRVFMVPLWSIQIR